MYYKYNYSEIISIKPNIPLNDPFLLSICPSFLLSLMKIKKISKNVKNGNFILYWCQNCPRVENNPALYYSLFLSYNLKLPIIIFTNLAKTNNKQNYFRSLAFQKFNNDLKKLNISLVGLYMDNKDVYVKIYLVIFIFWIIYKTK